MRLSPMKGFMILALAVQLVHPIRGWTEPMRRPKSASGEEAAGELSLAAAKRMVVVAYFAVAARGVILGRIAAYDDPETLRPVDHVELIDSRGGLLAVGWFDQFGIKRIAADQALVGEADESTGLLVLLIGGTAI